jgi:hypothetical protein
MFFRFLEAFPVFWWKYKWNCEVCPGCCCHSVCCFCFAKAALKDDQDPRVAMLKGGIQMGPSSVPNHMVPPGR